MHQGFGFPEHAHRRGAFHERAWHTSSTHQHAVSSAYTTLSLGLNLPCRESALLCRSELYPENRCEVKGSSDKLSRLLYIKICIAHCSVQFAIEPHLHCMHGLQGCLLYKTCMHSLLTSQARKSCIGGISCPDGDYCCFHAAACCPKKLVAVAAAKQS